MHPILFSFCKWKMFAVQSFCHRSGVQRIVAGILWLYVCFYSCMQICIMICVICAMFTWTHVHSIECFNNTRRLHLMKISIRGSVSGDVGGLLSYRKKTDIRNKEAEANQRVLKATQSLSAKRWDSGRHLTGTPGFSAPFTNSLNTHRSQICAVKRISPLWRHIWATFSFSLRKPAAQTSLLWTVPFNVAMRTLWFEFLNLIGQKGVP